MITHFRLLFEIQTLIKEDSVNLVNFSFFMYLLGIAVGSNGVWNDLSQIKQSKGALHIFVNRRRHEVKEALGLPLAKNNIPTETQEELFQCDAG